jgi:hypothetical protein
MWDGRAARDQLREGGKRSERRIGRRWGRGSPIEPILLDFSLALVISVNLLGVVVFNTGSLT